jgi:HEAT repeat protein
MHGNRFLLPAAFVAALITPGWLLAQALNREQTEAKISAHLLRHEFQPALSIYDSYVGRVKKPDIQLLRPIATMELRMLAQSQNEGVRIQALYQLAGLNDEAALRSLRQAAESAVPTQSGLAPLISLVRLGDKPAAARLGGLLDSAPSETKPAMIRALQDARARSEARRLVPLLGNSDLSIRTAAALAIGSLEYHDASALLREMMGRDQPVERMVAALALTRLGDGSADAHVQPLLDSVVPEIRLMAAEAAGPSTRARWVPKVKELTRDRNELVRVRAAEVLACCDTAGARATLIEALGSSLPSVQVEAARVLMEKELSDPRLARRLLGHPHDEVRTFGAGAVLRLADRPARRH